MLSVTITDHDIKILYKNTDQHGYSMSGMSRRFVVLVVEQNRIRNISWMVAEALDYRRGKSEDDVVVTGCGMDMSFHLVCTLASTLFGYIDPQKDKMHTNCYGLNHYHL